VQNDARKFGVVLVMMRLPILRNHIDFDIARARFLLAELENGPAKIGPGPVIPETGMKHAHRLAIGGAEFVAAEALVVPDVLQEPFRADEENRVRAGGTGLLLRAPLRIKVRPWRAGTAA
jgi:hypothetical protein